MKTERILVNPSNVNFRALHKACNMTRYLYNAADYKIRQAFFKGITIFASEVDKEFKSTHEDCYVRMPSAASAQRTLQILGDAWKSFWAAREEFKNSPAKSTRRPKVPGYANKQKTFVVGRNGFKIEDSKVYISGYQKLGLKPFKIKCCQQQHFNEEASKAIVKDIRFVPYGNCYYIEVVYDDGQASSNNVLLNKSNVMGIDLGINNLATIVFNQPGICPVLINGKPIKSINHRFNKYKKELQEAREAKHINCIVVKRRNRINDYFHKASKRIIDLCLKTHTGTIVIGYNKGWKESSNIGKVNNQNFTNIPHLALVNKIKYKAKKYGIDVIVTEESYTSKASSLDLDDIPTYGLVKNKKPVFSGTRVKRGLYKAKNGALLNADVNGSINIIRKVFKNASVKKLFNSGCVFQPIRVTC